MTKQELLQSIQEIHQDKKARKKFPNYAIDIELVHKHGQIVRELLLELVYKGVIRMGPTVNHKYIVIIKNENDEKNHSQD